MNRTLKNTVFLILLFTLILSSYNNAVAAIRDSGTCGAGTDWTLSTTGTLTISGSGSMDNWSSKSEVPWYRYRPAIRKLIIEDGVYSIGDYAFYGCSNLSSVSLPIYLEHIGIRAFCNCSALTSIVLPEYILSIDYRAFYNCSSLTQISVPINIDYISGQAFYGCSSLSSVAIPGHVIYGAPESNIEGTFSYYFGTDISEVIITDGTDYIGDYAFSGCAGLTSISFPNSLAVIGTEAFSGCTGLTSIFLPIDLAFIGENAFDKCENLKDVYIATLESWMGIEFSNYRSIPMYYADNLYINGDPLTHLVIPDGVSTLGNNTFSYCNNIISVSLPSGISSLGTGSFGLNLKKVYIPTLDDWLNISFEDEIYNPLYNGAVLYIGDSLLTELVIPDGVTSIKDFAFTGCSSISSIIFPSTVSSIGKRAFAFCPNLQEVHFSKSISFIDESAFGFCDNLEKVYAPSLSNWMAINFESNASPVANDKANLYINDQLLTDLVIPNGVTSIKNEVFNGCKSLTSVFLPKSLVSIGNSSFRSCSSLPSIFIPDSVSTIGSSAFSHCKSLSSISIPNGVHQIENYVLSDCENLSSITLPNSITSIGDYAISGCTNLKHINIPEGVTSIGQSAFIDCHNLESIFLPSSLNFIGDCSFLLCDSLKSVFIPSLDSWLNIYFDGVFSNPLGWAENIHINKSMLTHLQLPDGIHSIDGGRFQNCISLTSITFPESLTSLASNAFYNCTNLTDITFHGDLPQISKYSFAVSSSNTSSIQRVAILGTGVSSATTDVFPAGTTILCRQGSDVERWANKYSYPVSYLSSSNIPLSISLPETISVRVADMIDLPVQIFPAYPDISIAWRSVVPKVASVDNGIVTTYAPGKTTVMAIYRNMIAECLVSVTSGNSFILPTNIKSISEEAFLNTPCEYVVIPSSCTSIASRAFANAEDIALYMPDSVTDIADDAFDRCGKVAFICESDNAAAAYAREKGFTYRIEQLQ